MKRRISRALAAPAVLVVVALLGGACTSESGTGNASSSDDGGDGGGGSSGGGKGSGSTVGVTDDTIRIAYIGADFGALAEAGIAPDLGDQEADVDAVVDDINAGGGIAGRQVEVDFKLIGGTAGPEEGQAACLHATQEFKSFVVMLSPAIPREMGRCTAAVSYTHLTLPTILRV